MTSLSPKALPADCSSWPFPAQPSLRSFASSAAMSSSTRRRSVHTFPGSLPILPYTNHEWAKAVAEVKMDYANRHFRPCVKRCNEILDNLRDTTGVQPCYLIYLHFYAASAQETLARGLHHASPTRIGLLNEAQDHYSKASQLIASTDNVISRRSSKQDSISGLSSSSTSYVFGESSPTSTGSTRPSSMWSPGLPPSETSSSSRATSISSLDDDVFPTPTKEVRSSSSRSSSSRRSRRSPRTSVYSHYSNSSSISTPRSIERPDSPTLGLPPLSECSFQDLLDAMPIPPPSRSMSLDTGLSGLPPVASSSSCSISSITSATSLSPSSSSSSSSRDEQQELAEDVVFPSVQSARRCSLLLTDLQGQISRHLSFIETDLVAAHNPPPTATNLGLDEKKRRSMELQARIERLRAGGWRRPRFNAQRYEDLRESAIADMLA